MSKICCGLPSIILLCGIQVLAQSSACGRTFHVDSGNGRDSNDGLDAERAWRSLERVDSAELKPGDTVRFRCGGQWRGSLKPASGEEGAPVTYASYGRGAKPLILGSQGRSRSEDWIKAGEGVWATRPMEYREGERLLDLGESDWNHHQEAGAGVRVTRQAADGGGIIRVVCENSGTRSNHVQLWGPGAPVGEGTWLRLAMRARSSIPFHLPSMEILQAGAPWTRFGASKGGADIGAGWRDFEIIFRVGESAPAGHLHISLGGVLPAAAVFEFQPLSLHVVTPTVIDPLDVDVGNIIFDHGRVCGWKKWSVESLEKPYDYFYDRSSWRVYLKSEANPATLHESIECAMTRHVIDQGNTHDVVYDGLAVMYGAAHGFGGGNTRRLVIRGCDLAYIGGGHQTTRPDGHPVRYGNGIEFWGPASSHLVEGCRIREVYDAALTNQNRGGSARQEDIVYRNNIIWNCEYSFEYWNQPEDSVTRNIRFINNTCVDAGVVWSHAQRPDPNGSHLMFYTNTAATSDFEVKHNIFCGFTEWGSRYSSGWKPLPDISDNLWFGNRGTMVNWFGRKIDGFEVYQKETGLDSGSRWGDPRFTGSAVGDYRPAPDSPARGLRADGGPVGAESLWK